MRANREKIEIAMARAKIDRKGLAKRANMPIPTLCNVLQGKSCKPITIGKIAEALSVDVLEIVNNGGG